MEKIPITNDGKLKVEEELKTLKATERPRIINAIAEARAHGDLSENAEYHAAKEEQAHNETRIMELEDLLSKAEVIDPSKLSGEDIKFGAKVILIDLDTDEEAKYQIVGDIESDFKEKEISSSHSRGASCSPIFWNQITKRSPERKRKAENARTKQTNKKGSIGCKGETNGR